MQSLSAKFSSMASGNLKKGKHILRKEGRKAGLKTTKKTMAKGKTISAKTVGQAKGDEETICN